MGLSDRVVGRNFLALGAGEAVARLVAFGATVYLARTLGAAMFGVVGLATAVLLYFSYLVDCGIEMLGVREIAEDRDRVQTLAPAILTARIAVGAAVALMLLLAGVLVLPQPDGAVLAAYGLTLLAVGANTRWIHLGLESAPRVAIARTLGESLMVLLVLLLVHEVGDVGRIPLAQLVGDSFAALLLLKWLGPKVANAPAQLRGDLVRPVFARSWPLMMNALLGLLIYNSDLIFLRWFRDSATVGYYAAAYTLISFLLNLGVAYSLSLLPALTRLANSAEERSSLYHTCAAQVFAVSFPIAVGGYLLAPQIVRLVFGPSYPPTNLALQLLIWSVPISFLRTVPQAALIATGRQAAVLHMTAWATALNLLLNLTLIPRWGIAGAALATVATELFRTALALVVVRRAGFTGTPASRFARALTAGIAMGGVLFILRPESLWAGLGLGILIYASVLAVLGGIRMRWREVPALTV